MILNGLRRDIEDSRYMPTGGCREGRVAKDASAGLGEMGGAICFDPRLLATKNVSNPELQALALHEHAHHFEAEEDQAIRIETAILVKLADRNSVHYARSKRKPQWLKDQDRERAGRNAYDPSSEAENEDQPESEDYDSHQPRGDDRDRDDVGSGSSGRGGDFYCSARCNFNVVKPNPDYRPETSWWDFFFGDENIVRINHIKISARADVRFEAFLQLQSKCEDLCADAQGDICRQGQIGQLRTIGDVTWNATEKNSCRLVN